jgi:PadR family transcriptional regulator, regulatory protein PadR
MERSHLGEFEELILLTVGVQYKEPYAVAIAKEITKQSDRDVNISAVHKSLYRLEEKGMLTSKLGDPESKRGGKRKRLFYITAYGKKALDQSLELRMSLRSQIPAIAFK